MNEADLVRLQQKCAERIRSDAWLRDVAVLERREGVIDSDVANALGVLNTATGKRGAVIIVAMPAVDVPEPNAPGPMLSIQPSFRVIERPLLNRREGGTQRQAEEIAIRLLRLIHLVQLGCGTGTLVADKRAMEPAALGDPQAIGYDVFFTAQGGLDWQPVAMPQAAVASGSVTLTCATAGAEIYYTLDGSYPRAGVGTRYDAAFAVETGQTLLCCAYQGEKIPSAVLITAI